MPTALLRSSSREAEQRREPGGERRGTECNEVVVEVVGLLARLGLAVPSVPPRRGGTNEGQMVLKVRGLIVISLMAWLAWRNLGKTW